MWAALLFSVIIVLIVLPVISVIFSLLFWRSSPQWPKTFHQLWIELLFQYHGVLGVLQDKLNRSSSKDVQYLEEPQRVAIVTGGNRGIGVHVVDKLLKCGITVIVAVRNVDRAKEEISKVIEVSKFEGKIHIESLDMSDFSSIRRFAEAIAVKFAKIDILIHNAGIMACPYKLSVDGFESQMATNYLGPFLLTHLLLPQIIAAGTVDLKSRIVFVSSCLHLAGNIPIDDFKFSSNYYPVEAYMNSKLCQVAFGTILQQKFNEDKSNILVYFVHPGIVDTDLLYGEQMKWLKRKMFKTPEEGSHSIVFAALSKTVTAQGGSYISNCAISHHREVSPISRNHLMKITYEIFNDQLEQGKRF